MNEKNRSLKIVFIAVCIVLSAGLQVFQEYFIYWRLSFFEQPWRWWTAHWVHVGWIHFLLNAVAFACLPFIFPQIKTRYFVALLCLLPLLMSFIFYFYYPQIEAYAGLSGVLHGLYMAAAIEQLKFKSERHFSVLVIGLVMFKMLWENFIGSLHTSELIGSPVLIEAHFVGAIWGGVLAILWLIVQSYRKKIAQV